MSALGGRTWGRVADFESERTRSSSRTSVSTTSTASSVSGAERPLQMQRSIHGMSDHVAYGPS